MFLRMVGEYGPWSLVQALTRQIFSLKTNDSLNVTWSSLTAVQCFDDGYMGKQQVAWEEYCADYW